MKCFQLLEDSLKENVICVDEKENVAVCQK